ncbi:universal stress protein [Ostreibacterium oceani]|uniref:Universal stress protein n=1 Tax=Ostreibacterium oceani TaxID=2654998 RepID=A0A6N7ET20_9GAMM|nr:universal stress protein [Ostreibacterium oceani]MPV85984.1 universal stress protein [Ostreibacterium oceani]
MSKCYVVGIDGSEGGVRAAKFAAEDAKAAGATLKIIHVLEWSAYSFLTPEELEQRHKRREEDLTKAKTAILNPLVSALGDYGIQIDAVVKYGNIAETLVNYGKESNATHIFVGRHGGSKLSNRIFGSVPANLVQIADVPVTVVP